MTAEEAAMIMMSGGGSVVTETKKIDDLPVWCEVIINDSWSVKFKRSDSGKIIIDDTVSFSYTGDTVYVSGQNKFYSMHTCVYKGGQLIFGFTDRLRQSDRLGWGYSDGKTYQNAVTQFPFTKINKITAQKSGTMSSLTGLAIDLNLNYDEIGQTYNPDGSINNQWHSKDLTAGFSKSISSYSMDYDFYADANLQRRAENHIALGQAITNSKAFEYKIYE